MSTNKIIARARQERETQCQVEWCEGHDLLSTETVDEVTHFSRGIFVQFPVGRQGKFITDMKPAGVELIRCQEPDEAVSSVIVQFRVDEAIAYDELHDFADALRNFADYLDVNRTQLVGVR
jgi:hypothetical protein